MNTNGIHRRKFLQQTLASLALCSLGSPVWAQNITVRFSAWGTSERDRITREAVRLFEVSHPGTNVVVDFTDWLDYWRQLSTLAATLQTPDLIQMDYRYLEEYAVNGVLLPLDEFLGDLLQLDSFGQHNIDSCRVAGQLYGVNLGVNATAACVDLERWQETGAEPPAMGDSWSQFREKCIDFAKTTPRDDFYPTLDGSGLEVVFESWLLQRGKHLYTADGDIGFDAADTEEWFDYWSELRDRKACVSADIQVLYKNSIETSPLILGYAAMDFAHSNMMVNYQYVLGRPIRITGCPITPGGLPGHYYKPSQMVSVAASTEPAAVPTVVALANFLVMDAGAVSVLGVDRGVPASSLMREIVTPSLDPVSQATVQYIQDLTPYVGPLPPLPPQGAGEVAIVLQRIGHEIGYQVLSPRQGSVQLVREARAILAR